VRLWALIVLAAGPAGVVAQVGVMGPLTYEVEVRPGHTHSGTIVLQNNGAALAEVKLYQTDYRTEGFGSHYYDDPGTNPRSNASWVHISPMRFSIPAGENYTISYVMEIPADDTLNGTYWSMLMVEPIPAQSPESTQAEPDAFAVGIVTVFRYAVALVAHIDNTGTVQPEIEGATLSYSEDHPTLKLGVRNIGTRLFKLDIWMELYDSDGTLVARREGDGGRIFPTSSREFHLLLDDIPTGEYTTLIVMDAGENNVFGASFPIQIE
jgi:hypothetical protein